MADPHLPKSAILEMLHLGGDAWNDWRSNQLGKVAPDLEREDISGLALLGADLSNANLRWANIQKTQLGDADLSHADLTNANLSESNLSGATLRDANLFKAKFHCARLYKAILARVSARRANFHKADLSGADFSNADLSETNLQEARLSEATLTTANLTKAALNSAILREADLRGANLSCAQLVQADLTNADISGCRIYGISAWDVKLSGTRQSNLIVTPETEPDITVDDLEIAHFIYLLLNNQKIRNIIDNVTTKVVLILGRFLPETKLTLYELKNEFRRRGYCPVMFDFEKPHNRDFVETVCTIAHLSRFVVADFTMARIILEEVPHIVRNVAVPIVPLMKQDGGREPVTLENLRRNHKSVLETRRYINSSDLIENLERIAIVPAEAKARELAAD